METHSQYVSFNRDTALKLLTMNGNVRTSGQSTDILSL